MKANIKQLDEYTDTLLDLMGVKANVEVTEDKDNDALLVDIDAADSTGLLIGSRGDTVTSIQTILGMMMRDGENWTRVLVNVGDWREKNEGRIQRLADQTKERVVATGKEQPLYNLTAAERRIIHTYFANDKEVTTESEGEGQERYLVVKPK